MALVISNVKTNTVPSWTQAEIDATIGGNPPPLPPGTILSGFVVSDDWNTPLATSMATNKLLGRATATTGVVEEINLGAGLSFDIPSKTLNVAAGTGTVTTVSVVSANGFAGTVLNPTTTPVITLTTTITGLLKGNGTAISAAIAGTDYLTPTGAETVTNKDLTSGTNTFPTFNQNTTGSAAKWTTPRLLAGNSVDGSANVPFANKFISQGTSDTGLSGAQFLGALGTGIVKNTTTTGVLSIAIAADFPTLNQNTTGSAATLTTPRAINGVNFDGSAAITVTAAAGTLTGATLNSSVLNSSLTSLGSQAQALDMNSHKINNVTDPTSAQDAATKNYVDSVAQGLSAKVSARLATAAALPTNTYNNGASGIGATLTGIATGVLTVDGVAVALNDRIVVKNEVTGANNGLYICATAGAIGVAFILMRTNDADTSPELDGAFVFIESGTANTATGWVIANSSVITIGTTPIVWTQFSGAGTYVAGTGLTLTGNSFAVNASQTQITALGTIGTGTWQGTVVAGQYGGTGVANTGKTITLGGNFATSGAFAATLTLGAATNVTLPSTGTLATLAGTEALSNKDLTAGTNTFPTFNQNTTGSAAKWTTARNLAGNSVDGSANVAFANKFIVQGTTDAGLSGAQFLGALATGIVKNTTTTGVLSIAAAGTDYQAPITLTTTGTSGAATFIGNTLNIPNYASGGGSGTVTTVSVVSANGFAGTVATATTTPAITLTTTITGLLKGNGTAISAATAGTDYLSPTGAETVTNKDLTSGTNTFPTFNQNTTGSAAKWTTARTLAGNSVDGSANVAFANKFIAQGTADAGLSAAQFLGALGTGLLKNTTTTGVLSIAAAGTDYQAPISLTTTGTSGAATFISNVLNIPQYSGGGGSPGGSTTQIQFNDAGAFGGDADFIWDKTNNILGLNGQINFTGKTTNPSNPSAGIGTVFTQQLSATSGGELQILGSLQNLIGFTPMQRGLYYNHFVSLTPLSSSTKACLGGVTADVGLVIGQAPTSTSFKSAQFAFGLSTGAVAGTFAQIKMVTNTFARIATTNRGGFFAKFGPFNFTAMAANGRFFFGMMPAATIGNVEPDTVLNMIGLGCKAGQTTMSIYSNDGTSTATATSLGANFPVNTTDMFDLYLYCPPGGAGIGYQVNRYTADLLTVANTTSGVITTDLPVSGTYMSPTVWLNNGSSGALSNAFINQFYVESYYG